MVTVRVWSERGDRSLGSGWVYAVDGDDAIVAIDGERVRSLGDLQEYLFEHTTPGDTATLTGIRDGDRTQVEVTLGVKQFPRERIPST